MTEVMHGPVLECVGIRKAFGDLEAVKDIGFSIGPGETYGLLGPNGAGKTTTISIIAGLLDRDGGQVRLAGEPMSPNATRTKRLVGLVPQDLAIYPDLGASENLEFFGRLQGLRGQALKQRVAQVLDMIELTDRADDRTETYSGGMKRRLNIGIGLLHRPALLILDEPTVGVDP
jgi:ABC-2 type transport system ATP-binding protein